MWEQFSFNSSFFDNDNISIYLTHFLIIKKSSLNKNLLPNKYIDTLEFKAAITRHIFQNN